MSLLSDTESWVDLAADAASLHTQQGIQLGSSGFRSMFNAQSGCCSHDVSVGRMDIMTYRLKMQARRLRRRCIFVFKVVKAIATCSFTVRLHVHFELD